MTNLGGKISALRENCGLSQRQLAQQLCQAGIHVTNQAISKWENGNTQPSATQFLALCQVLGITDISVAFLNQHAHSPFDGLNQEGQEKALEFIDLLRRSGLYCTEPVQVKTATIRSLPLYHISVSAGTGQFLDSDHYDLVEVGEEVPMSANFGVRISGDSMQPRFIDGQIVWVHQQQTINDGEIGIFLYNGDAYCKKFSQRNGTVTLISLNHAYSPIAVETNSEFRVFGKVVG